MTRSERHLSPYGYPCGNHMHATPDARLYCQSDTPIHDVFPELQAVGLIWTKRGNQERDT